MGESNGHDPQKGWSQPWAGGRNPVGIERALSDGFSLGGVSKIVAADVRRRKGVRFPPEIRLLMNGSRSTVPKRQGTGAVQDASRIEDGSKVRQLLDCACPLALSDCAIQVH